MRKILIASIIFIAISQISSCSKGNEEVPEGSLTIERDVPEPGSPVFAPGDFEELKFVPPLSSEKIIIEEDGISDPKTNKILIFKKFEDKKELLFTIMPKTNFFYIRENKGNIYFTIEDSDIYNDPQNDLWMIDVKKGIIRNTHIRIGGDFEFSEDQKYLCFVFNDYTYLKDYSGGKIAYYIIKLLELESSEIKIFDFYDAFPRTYDATKCKIKMSNDRFIITYKGDGGGTPLEGYILLSDKKFYQTK